jgi:hypothetical protein
MPTTFRQGVNVAGTITLIGIVPNSGFGISLTGDTFVTQTGQACQPASGTGPCTAFRISAPCSKTAPEPGCYYGLTNTNSAQPELGVQLASVQAIYRVDVTGVNGLTFSKRDNEQPDTVEFLRTYPLVLGSTAATTDSTSSTSSAPASTFSETSDTVAIAVSHAPKQLALGLVTVVTTFLSYLFLM